MRKYRLVVLQFAFLFVEILCCGWVCYYKFFHNEYYWIENPVRYFFAAIHGGGSFGLAFWEGLFLLILICALILCLRWTAMQCNRFLTASYFVLTFLQLWRLIQGIKADIWHASYFDLPFFSVLHVWDGILLGWLLLGIVTAMLCLRHIKVDM